MLFFIELKLAKTQPPFHPQQPQGPFRKEKEKVSLTTCHEIIWMTDMILSSSINLVHQVSFCSFNLMSHFLVLMEPTLYIPNISVTLLVKFNLTQQFILPHNPQERENKKEDVKGPKGYYLNFEV